METRTEGSRLKRLPVVVKDEHDEVVELGKLGWQRREAVVFGVELPERCAPTDLSRQLLKLILLQAHLRQVGLEERNKG